MNNTNKRFILFELSVFTTGLLICPESIAGITGTIGVGLVLSILFHYMADHNDPRGVLEPKVKIACLIFSAVLSSVLLYHFMDHWIYSSIITKLTGFIHISRIVFVAAVGAVLALGSVFFFSEFLQICIPKVRKSFSFPESTDTEKRPGNPADQKIPILHRVIVAICAVGFITVCSRSSPLYPLNNWDDANCFFTVGKSMFNGLVPYRDLIEQKGPLLYFLYGLTWFVSNDSFLGGYILEIIAAYFYLLYSLRILKLFIKHDAIILIPIIALITYTAKAFEQGGSAEELCLPLLSASLLIMIRDMQSRKADKAEMLALGFAAGCVFWIKFSLIGLYLGWFLWLVCVSICRGDGKEVFRKTLFIGGGVILATVPWMLYFGVNHAVRDWLVVYLYDNIFIYTQASAGSSALAGIPVLGSLLYGLKSFSAYHAGTFIILAVSYFLLFMCGQKRVSRMLFALTIGAFVFLYAGGRRFQYYSLILDIFLAPGIALLYSVLLSEKGILRIEKARRIITIASLAICLCCSFLTPNRYFMSVPKEDLAQYRFKEIMLSENKDATMLNYGFLDGGFYTVTGIVPNCKAFCGLNIPLDELKELQDYYVKNGLCDYVITKSTADADDNKELELYECIAECTSDYSWGVQTYRLYRLKH